MVDQATGAVSRQNGGVGHSPGHCDAGVAASGLGEMHPALFHLRRRGEVGQRDAGEGQAVRAEPDGSRAEAPAS